MNNKFSDKESLKYQLLNSKIIRTKNNQYYLTYKDTNIIINPSNNYIGFLFLYVLEMLKKEIKNKDNQDDEVLEINNLSLSKNNVNDNMNNDINNNVNDNVNDNINDTMNNDINNNIKNINNNIKNNNDKKKKFDPSKIYEIVKK